HYYIRIERDYFSVLLLYFRSFFRGSLFVVFIFFFFSSRRRHTSFSRDWSSDVCSSDLTTPRTWTAKCEVSSCPVTVPAPIRCARSEERRVGKECRSRWSRYH